MIRRRLMEELPFMATENLMMRSVKRGGDRQELHERVRRHSVAAGERDEAGGAGERPARPDRGDGPSAVTREELEEELRPELYVGRAPSRWTSSSRSGSNRCWLSSMLHAAPDDPGDGRAALRVRGGRGLAGDAAIAANLREMRRNYERAVRLPTSLVREMAQTTTLALQAWRERAGAQRLRAFAPWLEKIVGLSRAQARVPRTAPTADSLYDALMDGYEPGATRRRAATRCSASCE
jgi:hypothetical protein